MQNMCEALKGMGLSEEDMKIPEIDSCEIISTADELRKMVSDEIEGDPGDKTT